MAGAGAKKFPAFSKLSSDDVNNYLADQVIMRFATTTARDAAFGGVGEPTLAEGMTAYIDADNSIYTYDGSNWVKMVSASQPVGLILIKTVSLAGAQSSMAVTDVFSSEFDNYRVSVGYDDCSASNTIRLQFSGLTGSNYFSNGYQVAWQSSFNQILTTAETSWNLGYSFSGFGSTTILDIMNPQRSAQRTFGTSSSAAAGFGTNFAHQVTVTTATTGFTISPASGTITNPVVRVYGYRQ